MDLSRARQKHGGDVGGTTARNRASWHTRRHRPDYRPAVCSELRQHRLHRRTRAHRRRLGQDCGGYGKAAPKRDAGRPRSRPCLALQRLRRDDRALPRYSPRDLRALTRPELELISLRQLDSVGTLAFLANSFLLRSQMPTLSQILLWVRIMVPMSRLLDPLLAYRSGKSIIAVWRRRSDAGESGLERATRGCGPAPTIPT
jgi:hypothetical protein